LTVWEGRFCIDAVRDSRLAVLIVWEGCFCIYGVRDSTLPVVTVWGRIFALVIYTIVLLQLLLWVCTFL
jgi:uncharacterized membrane protein